MIAPFGRLGSTYLVDAPTAERVKRIDRNYAVLSYLSLLLAVVAQLAVLYLSGRTPKGYDVRIYTLVAVCAALITSVLANVFHRRAIFVKADKISIPGFPPSLAEFMQMSESRWVLVTLGVATLLVPVSAIGSIVLLKTEWPSLVLIAILLSSGLPAYLFLRAAFWRKPENGTKYRFDGCVFRALSELRAVNSILSLSDPAPLGTGFADPRTSRFRHSLIVSPRACRGIYASAPPISRAE